MTEFQRIMEEMIDRKSVVLLAKVDAVDDGAMTFDCTPVAGGAKILDARIRPVADQGDLGLLAIPKLGTFVVVVALASAQWVLLSAAEWERFELRSPRCSLVMRATGEVEIVAESILLESSNITLGSTQGAEPFVKGDELGSRFAELYNHVTALHNMLLAMAISGAAACVGPMAPLAPSFTAIGTAVGVEMPLTGADSLKFPLVKSQKVKGS